MLGLVSRNFTRWRIAAPHFGLDDGAVAAIDSEKHDEEGKRLELLRRWQQKFGYDSTNEKLIRCLLASVRADLATIVAKETRGEVTSEYLCLLS